MFRATQMQESGAIESTNAMTEELFFAGVPWFRREDYERVLAVLSDAASLPRSYDAWCERAEAKMRELENAGFTVIRAVIDPDEFPNWCRSRGLQTDWQGRREFAKEAVTMASKIEHNPAPKK
jgi:hypothetical protein